MHLDIGILSLEVLTDFILQLTRKITVIELNQFTLIIRIGIGLLQRHIDDGRLEVIGDQSANLTRLEHVSPQLIEIGFTGVRRPIGHRTAIKAVLGHLGPAYVWRP